VPAAATRVCLEQGKTWVFASALDWPGWCRRGKGDEAALDMLAGYAARYALVAGPGFAPGPAEVVGRVKGSATTDFGAPGAAGPWDHEPLDHEEAGRLVGLLEASWRYFDAVVADAPAQLRKGPRGGGRDRDAIAGHVREAERAYSAKTGTRIPPRTPWPEQRAAVSMTLRATTTTTASTAAAATTTTTAAAAAATAATWPVRYTIRRFAWHVLDHAWEIEDKSDRSGAGEF
jgi:hypothetical protein